MAHTFAAFISSSCAWHFLYFLPLPHQQGSFLPGRACGTPSSLLLNSSTNFSKIPIFHVRLPEDMICPVVPAKYAP
jgi:hypothetical protein